ncbi:MAG TPA: DUF4864 domain-containing protein [Beijerinckiaceae bacterium]
MLRWIIVFFLAWSGAAAALESADKSAIRGVIEQQIDAMRRDDGAAAYGYAAPTIQRMFPNQESFMRMVREGYRPVYKPRSVLFGELKDSADEITQSVLLRDADGEDWLAIYSLERQADGSWKISGCRLTKDLGESA